MSVLLETSKGNIVIDLYINHRAKTCLNFLKLCKIKYYNFCLFHSVQRNLVAQTGDPTGSGKGGESIFYKLYGEQAKYFEAESNPIIKHAKLGTVSMVNNGSGGHGSQFFITLAENLSYLDGVHTVFGEVAEGFDVLTKINESYCDADHRPYQDIRIMHTIILDDPTEDPPGFAPLIPSSSPIPTKEQMNSGRIGIDEAVDDFKGMSQEELEEYMKEREARANAQILEMVGDIPTAEIKPAENVLFVCKLNPVTTAEDLEIIFSRFGPIASCEVVKDQKSGESLQYAFIEFETNEACENAFFKMDNVLIDDRRIHVDFSQSVAKLQQERRRQESNLVPLPPDDETNVPRYAIKDRSKRGREYEYVFSDDDYDSDDSRSRKSRSRKYTSSRATSSSSTTSKRPMRTRKRTRIK